MKRAIESIISLIPSQPVYAHCDIPCGIYDPHQAQLASHTVLRMTNMIIEANAQNSIHYIARLTQVKEESAEIVKHEVRVIWGDYFKEEHLKNYPDLHDLVFKIMKLASKAKQEVSIDASKQLIDKVQEFSEIFYKTKGVNPIRVKSIYPTEGEMVVYG